MNKQEVINDLKGEMMIGTMLEHIFDNNKAADFRRVYNGALELAIEIIDQIDEPEKPVVPQFVADFIGENIGDSCTKSIGDADYYMEKFNEWYEYERLAKVKVFNDRFTEELGWWMSENMVFFYKACTNGYKVEKEKLYHMPVPYQKSDQVYYCGVGDNITTKWSADEYWHHKYTQAELDKYFPEIKHMAIEVEDHK